MKGFFVFICSLFISGVLFTTSIAQAEQTKEKAQERQKKLEKQLGGNAIAWVTLIKKPGRDGVKWYDRAIAVVNSGTKNRLILIETDLSIKDSESWLANRVLDVEFATDTNLLKFVALPGAITFEAEDPQYLVKYYWDYKNNINYYQAVSKKTGKLFSSKNLKRSKVAQGVVNSQGGLKKIDALLKVQSANGLVISYYRPPLLIIGDGKKRPTAFLWKDKVWKSANDILFGEDDKEHYSNSPRKNNSITHIQDLNGDGIPEFQGSFSSNFRTYTESSESIFMIKNGELVSAGVMALSSMDIDSPNCSTKGSLSFDNSAKPYPIIIVTSEYIKSGCTMTDDKTNKTVKDNYQWDGKAQKFKKLK